MSAAILGVVARRIFQFMIAFVLTTAALAPIAELFDRWDKDVVPANDTELCVAATCAFAGLVVTVAMTIRRVPALASDRSLRNEKAGQPQRSRSMALAQPTASPPPFLLRI